MTPNIDKSGYQKGNIMKNMYGFPKHTKLSERYCNKSLKKDNHFDLTNLWSMLLQGPLKFIPLKLRWFGFLKKWFRHKKARYTYGFLKQNIPSQNHASLIQQRRHNLYQGTNKDLLQKKSGYQRWCFKYKHIKEKYGSPKSPFNPRRHIHDHWWKNSKLICSRKRLNFMHYQWRNKYISYNS